jgi:hypothetical protein
MEEWRWDLEQKRGMVDQNKNSDFLNCLLQSEKVLFLWMHMKTHSFPHSFFLSLSLSLSICFSPLSPPPSPHPLFTLSPPPPVYPSLSSSNCLLDKNRTNFVR